MISYKQSRNKLKRSKILIKDEFIKSTNSLNRVSASNILSLANHPAADNAAFDGFAINSKDTKKLNKKKRKLFKILRTVVAGDKPFNKKLKKFQSVEIMTGGVIPNGFDTIIPIEQIIFYPNKIKPTHILIDKKVSKFQHVRFKGSDFKKNDLLIKKGTILQSNHILALKTLGITNIKVKKNLIYYFFPQAMKLPTRKEFQTGK